MISDKQDQNRNRILDATESLLKAMGRDALTIRAVADAAEVQLPTIYRLFEDKVGLLDAVTERGFLRYMAIDPGGALGPIDQLRHGWDIHVRFGLEYPQLYALMFGDLHARKVTPAARIALDGLRGLIRHLAASGCLTVSEEQATFMAFASGSGAVLSMYFLPGSPHRESCLKSIRETLIASITTEPRLEGDGLLANAASTLGGNLDRFAALSPGERGLFREWLERILAEPERPPDRK